MHGSCLASCSVTTCVWCWICPWWTATLVPCHDHSLLSCMHACSGVTGHFPDGPGSRPWVSIDEQVTDKCAKIVGTLIR